MLAPVQRALRVMLFARQLVEGAVQHLMQLTHWLVVARLGGSESFLGEVVAWHIERIDRVYAIGRVRVNDSVKRNQRL